MDEESTVVSQATEVKQEHIICPCCGKPTLNKPITVSPEVLDHYMACILTGTPFWRSYNIYKGKATLSITMLSTAQRDALNTLYGVVGEVNRILVTDSAHAVKLTSIVELIRTAMYIKEAQIRNTDGDIAYTAAPLQAVMAPLALYTEQLKAVCAADDGDEHTALKAVIDEFYNAVNVKEITTVLPLQVLILCVNAHIQLFEILVGCGFDVNFWDGIELA